MSSHILKRGAELLSDTRDTVSGIAAGTLLERWPPAAKDGFDLPATRSLVPARQVISTGETYDFDYRPQRTGSLQGRQEEPDLQTVRKLLVTVPIRVE